MTTRREFPIVVSRSADDPERRPPLSVVIAAALAAIVALASAAAAIAILSGEPSGALGALNVLWLSAWATAFVVSSVRRDRWPWGVTVTLGIVAGAAAVVVGAVALATRNPAALRIAALLGAAATAAGAAFLRRPARDWYGYACGACGAFRWPMRSAATRVPCRRCGAPAGERDPGGARPLVLPQWIVPMIAAAWVGAAVMGMIHEHRERARGRAELLESHRPIRLVGWTNYEDAVATIADVTGARPVALGQGTCARGAVPKGEGRAFVLDSEVAERILEGSHLLFREGGLYLFRCERGHASGRRMDVLAVMPTRDPRVVIRRLGTGAPGRGVGPDDVVGTLEALSPEASFEVTEVGVDYVAARLDDVPSDPTALARKVMAAAPALRQITSLRDLAEELRSDGRLYLWWPDAEVLTDLHRVRSRSR